MSENNQPAPVAVDRPVRPEPVERLRRYAGQTMRTARNPNLTAREAISVGNWMAAMEAKLGAMPGRRHVQTQVAEEVSKETTAQPGGCAEESDCTHMPWCRIRKRCQRATPPAPVVPPGWRMVPEKPHMGMQAAGVSALYEASEGDIEATGMEIGEAYRAMLDAAPKAPVLAPAAPQPLTDTEFRTLAMEVDVAGGSVIEFARAVEAEVIKRMQK